MNNNFFVCLGNFGEVSDEEEQREWVMTIIMLSVITEKRLFDEKSEFITL